MNRFSSVLEFWNARTAREQIMLQGLALVLGGLLFWYGVLTPLKAATTWTGERRQVAAAELSMIETAARGRGGRGAPAAPAGLVGAIDVSAAAAGIVIERRRLEADGRLTVWVSAVEPRTLMQWIGGLQAARDVTVVDMTAAKADSGTLEVEVSFKGGDR